MIFTQVVGDAETERLLRGSPKKKALVKLPSFRSSSSQEEEEVAHDKKKGPFHGMTKKVVNLAANKAGKAPAKLMLKLGATASDVRKLRDLFNWEDATKTLGFLLVNLVAAVLHFYLPIRYFAMPVVVGMFFVLSEKSKAIERIACHAFAARKRYVHLRRLKKKPQASCVTGVTEAGWSALHICAMGSLNDVECATILLEAGVSPLVPVWKSKFYGAFASTSTPSTRRLLDGVAVPVPHRSTEAPDALVDFHTQVNTRQGRPDGLRRRPRVKKRAASCIVKTTAAGLRYT